MRLLEGSEKGVRKEKIDSLILNLGNLFDRARQKMVLDLRNFMI